MLLITKLTIRKGGFKRIFANHGLQIACPATWPLNRGIIATVPVEHPNITDRNKRQASGGRGATVTI
jgi:hypothetical protein